MIQPEDFFNERFDEVDCEENTDEVTEVGDAELTEPLTSLKVEELVQEQKEDEFCQEERARPANNSDCQYFEDHHRLICCCARKANAEEIILQKNLRREALPLAHYPRLDGHPGGCSMYIHRKCVCIHRKYVSTFDTYQNLRRIFYCPSMAPEAYHTC